MSVFTSRSWMGGLAIAATLAGSACGSRLDRVRPEPPSVAAMAQQPHRRGAVGVLERRDVDLNRVRLQLGRASRCRLNELADVAGPDGVLESGEAPRAGCLVRLYRGVLPVYAIDPRGRRLSVIELRTDREGFVDVSFAQIDAVLQAKGAGHLDDYERLELGTGAWAGIVNLDRLRGFLADWHYRWAVQGRGALGLFVIRHADDRRRAQAEAMVIQARVARQEQDYEKVQTGEMSAADFLERHVWSPFRRAVTGR